MVRALLLSALILLPGALRADDEDHDRARQAVERGVILPLSEILKAAEVEFGGRVIEVELDEDDGRYIYELQVIDHRGQLWEAEIDAATGALLDRERDD